MNINNLTIILLLYAFFDYVFLKKRFPLLNVDTTCPWSPGGATSHVLSCTLSYAIYTQPHLLSSPLLTRRSVHSPKTQIMSDTLNSAAARSRPSRLQRRRPASLQISPASSSSWNAAIPLLSPLITSPTAMDMKSRDDPPPPPRIQVTEGEKPVVFKKWQHPAAPFCYELAPFKPSFFVPVQIQKLEWILISYQIIEVFISLGFFFFLASNYTNILVNIFLTSFWVYFTQQSNGIVYTVIAILLSFLFNLFSVNRLQIKTLKWHCSTWRLQHWRSFGIFFRFRSAER